MRGLAHLEEDLGENGVKVDHYYGYGGYGRQYEGMLYADNAGIVPTSAEGLEKMMTVIVIAFEAAGLTVSETKTETMLRTPN